jgi:hypothetical protein
LDERELGPIHYKLGEAHGELGFLGVDAGALVQAVVQGEQDLGV